MSINQIYLVRHGENHANITKEFSWKRIDYGLTDRGYLQAEQAANYFKTKKIDALYTSPLKRAVQTTELIAEATAIDAEIMEEFREINVGDLELMKPDSASWSIYRMTLKKWFHGNKDARFPGGENYYELLQRFNRGLQIVTRNRANQNIVIVGHGGIFTAGIYELCDDGDKKYILSKANNNCSISKILFSYTDTGSTMELQKWAECRHLSGEAAEFVKAMPENF